MSDRFYSQEKALELSKEWFGGDELAAGVFITKYALRNREGNLLESTPDQMHARLAKEFSRVEENYPNPLSKAEIEAEFREYDEHLGREVFGRIVAQGSPMAGIGNDYRVMSISNCFVIDSPVDSYGGILLTDQQQAQIMKRRGGVGFDISPLRPKHALVRNAAQTSDGIGVFMERFSNTTREVAQNGRRGALMISISCHHPEVETFIEIKQDRTKVTGANVSVRCSDEFMEAVRDGTTYVQRFPVDPGLPHEEYQVWREVDARSIWQKMMKAAWESAEPGVLFWDSVMSTTPSECYADLGFAATSVNPCVVGSTEVRTSAGIRTVVDMASAGYFNVLTYNEETGESEFDVAEAKLTKHDAPILKLKTKSGKEIRLTADHKVYTPEGWVEAGNLKPGQKILKISS